MTAIRYHKTNVFMNIIQIPLHLMQKKKVSQDSSCGLSMRHLTTAAMMVSDTLMYCCSRDRRHALQLHQFTVLAE